MKKYIAIILLLLSNLAFAAKELSTLKTLKFNAEEKQLINGKEKILKYSVVIDFPNKIRKELIFPELNKGELYIYDGNKKLTYLPIFDEYKESQIDGDENRIIQTINKIRELEKNDRVFKNDYQQKKLKSLYVDDTKTTLVNIKKYLEQDGYILPENIEIKDGDTVLGTVFIKNVEVNPTLDKGTFELEKGKKWYFYEEMGL